MPVIGLAILPAMGADRTIHDPTRCIETAALCDALDARLGGDGARRIDVDVSLLPLLDQMQIEIDATWQRQHWHDIEVFARADCGDAVVLLAVDSVDAGTTDWRIRVRQPRSWLAIGPSVGVPLPGTYRGGWHFVPQGHATFVRDWRTGAPAVPFVLGRATVAAPIPGPEVHTVVTPDGVEHPRSHYGYSAVQLGVGRRTPGPGGLSFHSELLGGAALAFGDGLNVNRAALLPAIAVGTGLGLDLGEDLQLVVDLELSPWTILLSTDQADVLPLLLPPVRLVWALARRI